MKKIFLIKVKNCKKGNNLWHRNVLFLLLKFRKGMSLDVSHKILNKQEYEDFKNGKLLISRYSLDFKEKEKIINNYKDVFFAMLIYLAEKDELLEFSNVLKLEYDETFKKQNNSTSYDFIYFLVKTIEDNFDMSDFEDYSFEEEEMFEYISYQDWIEYADNNEDYISREVIEVENSYVLLQTMLFCTSDEITFPLLSISIRTVIANLSSF